MNENTLNKPSEGYDSFAYGLCKPGEVMKAEMSPDDLFLVHMAMLLAGEAGELLDAIKKATIYRTRLDIENVVEEMGDIEFPLAALRMHLGINREHCLRANRNKLLMRYPAGKYSNNAAKERADKQTTPTQQTATSSLVSSRREELIQRTEALLKELEKNIREFDVAAATRGSQKLDQKSFRNDWLMSLPQYCRAEARRRMERESLAVFIEGRNDLVAVIDYDEGGLEDFWWDAFDTLEEAKNFVDKMGWTLVERPVTKQKPGKVDGR